MEKLSWDKIREVYKDEWVELVDFDWVESEPYPRRGVVRVHHKDKKELKKVLELKDRPVEAALLYTGDKLLPQGSIFSANIHQFVRSS